MQERSVSYVEKETSFLNNQTLRKTGQNCDLYFLSVGNVILVNENQTTGYTYEGVAFDSQTNTVTLSFCDGDVDKGIRVDSTSAFCGNDIFKPTDFRIEGSTVRIDGSKCNVGGAGIGLAGQNNMIVDAAELEITAKGQESPFGFSGIGTSKINNFTAVNSVEFCDSTVTMEGPKGGQWGSVGISLSFGGNLTMRNSEVQMDYSKATGGRAITGNNRGYDAKLTIDNTNFKAIESKNFSGSYTTGFKTLVTKGNLSYKGGSSIDSMQDITKDELFQNVNGEIYRNYNCFSVTSSGGAGDVTSGDINEDGSIDIFDVVCCQNHITGTTELAGDAFEAADLNEDGIVDIMDLVQLQNRITTI